MSTSRWKPYLHTHRPSFLFKNKNSDFFNRFFITHSESVLGRWKGPLRRPHAHKGLAIWHSANITSTLAPTILLLAFALRSNALGLFLDRPSKSLGNSRFQRCAKLAATSLGQERSRVLWGGPLEILFSECDFIWEGLAELSWFRRGPCGIYPLHSCSWLLVNGFIKFSMDIFFRINKYNR